MSDKKYLQWECFPLKGQCRYLGADGQCAGSVSRLGSGFWSWRVDGDPMLFGEQRTLDEALDIVESICRNRSTRAAETSTGAKHDAGKLPWNLVPFRQLENVVKVYQYGAQKYGADTWQTVPNGKERYFGAIMRHLTAWRTGERVDQESGCHHLAHVAWGCLALMFLDGEK